jgi:hypothetical protein
MHQPWAAGAGRFGVYHIGRVSIDDGDFCGIQPALCWLGHARPSMTQDVYMGRKAKNPAAADALEAIADDL